MSRMASAAMIFCATGARRSGSRGRAALVPALVLVTLIALLPTTPAPAQGVAPTDAQFFRIGSGVVDSPAFAVAGIVAAGLSSPAGARPCERRLSYTALLTKG